MLVLIAVKSVKSASDKQTPYASKIYDKLMVCNLTQDSHISEAITKLEAKLETLIALVNNTCAPRPKSAGKLTIFLGLSAVSTACLIVTSTFTLSPNRGFSSLLHSRSRDLMQGTL